MAQGYDWDYSVTEEQRAHFSKLREDRGWSWEQLAEDFDRAWTDPSAPALAEWARAQDKPAAKRAARGGDKVEKRD
jgi:hypothetical protein